MVLKKMVLKKIVLILVIIVLFCIGFGMGILYQTQKDAPKIKKSEAIETLSSSVVASIAAYGQVTKIEGRNITLTFNNESITIPVAADASVYVFNRTPGQITPEQSQGDISQIKNGDYLNINIKLSRDGSIEGTTVVILPSVASTPTQ